MKLTEDEGGHVAFNNLIVANQLALVVPETVPLMANNLILPETIFEDFGQRDLRLAVDASAAIDGGVPTFLGLLAPLVDYGGATRAGIPDVGALERD